MKNLQTFLANFNVVILLVGYQVFTAVFEAIFDVDSELSQSFTVPYRAFTLAVSLLCIVVSLKVKALRAPGTLFLWLVWICILSRFVDTMYFSQYSPNTSYVLTTWLYMIGLTLIPMYSVLQEHGLQSTLELFLSGLIFYCLSRFFDIFYQHCLSNS